MSTFEFRTVISHGDRNEEQCPQLRLVRLLAQSVVKDWISGTGSELCPG